MVVKHLKKIIWGLLPLLPFFSGCQPHSASAMQEQFTRKLQEANAHFQQLERADTIDLATFTPFDWDTAYVFEGYTTGWHIAEHLNRIYWGSVMAPDDLVPENANRFIFVKGRKAVEYLDMYGKMIGKAHFAKYYPDTLGRVSTYYRDSTDGDYPYTVNHFAKAEARFILVSGVSIPVGDTSRFAYVPLALLKGKRLSSLGVTPSNWMDLHPLTGCGYPDCMANRSPLKQPL